MGASLEMPKYQSHKIVWGLKIKGIKKNNVGIDILSDDVAILSFVKEEYADRKVSQEYMSKHKPKIGGYFVVYKDGYQSWSPADVFEAGNTLIED